MLLPLLLLFTGVARGQLPFHPKFLASAGGLEDSPFLEAQRDALNLHEGDDASVAVAAPIAINCTARGTEFKATLLQKGACSRPSHARFNANKKLLRIQPRHFWDDAEAFCRRPCSAYSQPLRVSYAVISAGAVALQCDSACEDADEASGQWEVYGGPTGPFRMDSRVCKAALVAGIINRDGGEVRATRTMHSQ